MFIATTHVNVFNDEMAYDELGNEVPERELMGYMIPACFAEKTRRVFDASQSRYSTVRYQEWLVPRDTTVAAGYTLVPDDGSDRIYRVDSVSLNPSFLGYGDLALQTRTVE